jgi:hypothetical protein
MASQTGVRLQGTLFNRAQPGNEGDTYTGRNGRANRASLRISPSGTGRESMKPFTIAGVVLIVLGLAALAYQGVTYTTHETVLEVGPVHATADRQKTLPIPPIVGIIAVAGGAILLLTGTRARS